MSTTAVEPRTLADLYQLDRQIVEPMSEEARRRPYLSLEHVESHTGVIDRCRLGGNGDAGTSATFAFDSRHVLYGKLRPYLNKVATPDFEGRCTTEIIPLLPRPGVDREYLAWLLRSPGVVAAASQQTSGSRMPRADMDELGRVAVRVPSFAAQRRIAAQLTAAMAVVERARAAARDRLAAAEALPAAAVTEMFTRPEFGAYTRRRVDELCELLPSKSITNRGDAVVQVITTACLSERGFLSVGIKSARMRSGDVNACTVRRGEILVARSNTPDLVGRATLFPGVPAGVVASDLTIRLWCREIKDGVTPEYLSAYMSFLFLSGYWRNRARGASGSMKKITRKLLSAERIPVPPLAEQARIATSLAERVRATEFLTANLREQVAALDALPAALLCRVFNGACDGEARAEAQR